VVYRLRRAWRDGTNAIVSAIVFEPLAFLERLAALVPRPRAHLLTYHGVLAPAAQSRDRIVPGLCARAEAHHGSAERNSVCSRSDSCDFHAAHPSPARTRRLRWAELLRRVFAVDVLTCPHGRQPGASGRLEAALEPAQNGLTCIRGTGSTRPWARDLRGSGPNSYPLSGVIRLEFLFPARRKCPRFVGFAPRRRVRGPVACANWIGRAN